MGTLKRNRNLSVTKGTLLLSGTCYSVVRTNNFHRISFGIIVLTLDKQLFSHDNYIIEHCLFAAFVAGCTTQKTKQANHTQAIKHGKETDDLFQLELQQ